MQMRTGIGWQYALTDLSLILFLVAASALAKSPAKAPASAGDPLPQLADPVAIWRPSAGGLPLHTWLSGQPDDPRQRLTVIARYATGHAAEASADAAELLAGVPLGGRKVRILVEPGEADDLSAALTWDGAGDSPGSRP